MSKTNSNSGQSTIEFLMCFIYTFGLVIIFLNLSLNFTNGHVAHYANFMASRAYLVGDGNQPTAEQNDSYAQNVARKVFLKYKLSSFIKDTRGGLKFNNPNDSVGSIFTGTYYQFEQKFSSVPFMGGNETVDYLTESFLGKEPSRAECLEQICNAFRALGSNCIIHSTFFDNGC